MPKQKSKKTERNPVVEQLYDCLMGEIEPELMTTMLPQLAEIYADESAEEMLKRREHYQWAFAQCASLWDEFIAECKVQLNAIKEQAFATVKERTSEEEALTLQSLEKQFNHP